MSSASENSRVPAWKRLGLKLKQPGAAAGPAASAPVGHHSQGGHTPKRKFDAPPGSADDSLVGHGSGPKRPRRDEDRNAGAKQHKTVSFGDTPTKANLRQSGPSSILAASKSNTANAESLKNAQTPKKSKGPAKKPKPQPAVDLKPAIDYLRQWKVARESWKFNKNYQSQLIKHVFDDDGIPSSDIGTFYEYIRDLKGFVRTRLRESAMEVKAHDQAIGAKGFPEGTKDVNAKQSTYESMLADFFGPPPASNKRKLFDEADYRATSSDADVIIRRVIKRFRAELILDDLSDSGETDTSTTTTTTASSSDTITGSENTITNGDDKRLKLNAASGKRRRKLRTNVDDSSSSESESDSDSDASSDSSSSDESDDDDDDADPAATNNGYGSDSSSSSSSSSGEDSDSESDSDDEEEA